MSKDSKPRPEFKTEVKTITRIEGGQVRLLALIVPKSQEVKD